VRQRHIVLPDIEGLAAAYADERSIRDAYWHPERGDVVLDIGAGVGSYTLPALMEHAIVTAVDPDTVATTKLRLIAGLNGCKMLTICNFGVWESAAYPPEMHRALARAEQCDRVQLSMEPEWREGWSYLIPRPGTQFVTFDELAGPLTRLDWVKIDAEGAELGILRSGMASIARLHPRLIVELHDEVYPYVAQMDSARQCRELLEGLDYRIQVVPYSPPPRSYLICEPGL
jgi:FkbM family methyltransferase